MAFLRIWTACATPSAFRLIKNGKPGAAKMIIPFTNPENGGGRFVFHCHVVKHEDKGMMQTIEVRP
jgi:FtsP/CotA-like multicopper oxidase with cupredoxin domain